MIIFAFLMPPPPIPNSKQDTGVPAIRIEIEVDSTQRPSKLLLSELNRDWMDSARTVMDCYHAEKLNAIHDRLHKRCEITITDVPKLPGHIPRFRFSKYGKWQTFHRRMFVNSSWALRGVEYEVTRWRNDYLWGQDILDGDFAWCDKLDDWIYLDDKYRLTSPWPTDSDVD